MRTDLFSPPPLGDNNSLLNKITHFAPKEGNKEYTHIDCFAGPGGFCTGLTAARFKTLVAIEYRKLLPNI